MAKDIMKELAKIESELSDSALKVADVISAVIMEELPPGTVSPQDIIDGLEALLKITRLHYEVDVSKGH